MRWSVIGRALLAGALGWAGVTAAARADSAHTALRAAPAGVSAAQAIGFLNRQRALNGIPGDLVEDAATSQGCWNHTHLYVERRGQYPHTELRGQPGYTPAGERAAARSDLDGTPGFWNGTVNNPWQGAPLHLYSLFDPGATVAWYGEKILHDPRGGGSACMGTGVSDESVTPAAPGYYSVPGNGRVGVTPNYRASELPWTPGQTVGLDGITGPYILLYPHDVDATTIASATLRDAAGRTPAIKVVTPDTPAPPLPAGWPNMNVFGYYAIPVKPLRAKTGYTLTVNWSGQAGGPGVTQTVTFTTGATNRKIDQGLQCPPDICARGRLAVRTTATRLRITLNPAAGQRAKVTIMRGKRTCQVPRRPCPKRYFWFIGHTTMRRTVPLGHTTTTLRLPRRRAGLDALWVSVEILRPFRADGRVWPAASVSLTDFHAR